MHIITAWVALYGRLTPAHSTAYIRPMLQPDLGARAAHAVRQRALLTAVGAAILVLALALPGSTGHAAGVGERAGLTYAFPVQPAKAAQYGRYHHDYPATDIFCPVGSRFVAPVRGIVDSVSLTDRWDPRTDDPAVRGGLSVAIIGDDGVRYYGAHLSSVAPGIVPGVRVRTGQLLGLTGNSGNARYTPPHLHFGISRPTYATDWQTRRGQVSPYTYLRAWARGTALTPALPAAKQANK
jgi:murein DD-endopeptidase MepM/ murein hydrolase activator NlpD